MTDRGLYFNNGNMQAWCEANGTKHQITAPYAPWINGFVENANRQLIGYLRCLYSSGVGEENTPNASMDGVDHA